MDRGKINMVKSKAQFLHDAITIRSAQSNHYDAMILVE
jgi:hypothetical protein